MLTLRQEQIDALAKAAEKQFEDRVLAHLQRVWATECQAVGESRIRQSIREAIERGKALGFVSEYDLVRFIDLFYLLGRKFETNPRAQWAADILNQAELSPATKLDRLWERTEQEIALKEKRHANA